MKKALRAIVVLLVLLSIPLAGVCAELTLPDGLILFSGKIGNNWDLFLYSPQTGDLQNITQSPES